MIPATFNSTASVVSNGSAPIIQLTDSSNNRNLKMSTGSNSLQIDSNAGSSGTVRFGAQSGLQANLTADTTGTISALQTAVAIQDYLVRNQNGTRYTEFVYSHFGVVSPDGRLQRSEYLAGNSVPLNMVPVTQNSETATTPQGNLAGMCLMNSHDVRFIKSFTEHGYVIGLVSARSDRFYQQGTPRHWFDSTPYDFYVRLLS